MRPFIQVLILLISGTQAYAQTLFEPLNNATPPANTTQNAAPASPTNTPLSPSDFQKRVQSLEQAAKHRVKQQLPKPAAPTTPASSSPVTDVPSTAPASQPAVAPDATTPTTTPVPSESPTPAQPPAEQTASAPTPPAAAPPKQNEIYTGFGTPDAGKANAPASGGASQSTGWGIQY